jgi:hypothetical protein
LRPESIDRGHRAIGQSGVEREPRRFLGADKIANLGAVPLILSPAGFRQFLAEETAKWNKVARAARILPN